MGMLVRVSLLVTTLLIVSAFCKTEAEWEQEFLQIPSVAFAYEHMAYYTSLPHLAGTSEDYETALYTKMKLQSYGFTATIEEEEVLLTYPISRSLKLKSPTPFTCGLTEDYEPIDPSSADPRVVPTFNAYSASGNVTAQVVFVNYGSKDDFEYLKKQGIQLEGNIAIAKYGKIFRGTKAMIAQEYGCIGLIIYSDPADDGYAQGPVFPDGPWRSNSSVQRGSAQFLSVCPGNPTRKICVAEQDQDSFSYTQMIPSIPVQPISYGDAQPILAAIGGPNVPSNWAGALPITYHIGPGPATVELALDIKYVNTTIWNVIGTIPADSSSPVANQKVLIGNHRDAWVYGAVDPSSGSSVLLEIARSIGEMVRLGWKPQREIVICSWDGEEYGLLGSTAYAERHNQSLVENAIVYLNVDTGVSGGTFRASATPSLANLLRNVSTDVPYPGSAKNLSEIWNGFVGVLGSGSDYTSFIHHFGIPCADFAMDGDYGVYHSVYDSEYWMKSFGDPTFDYYVTLTQEMGLATMRLASLPMVSYNYTEYSKQLNIYLKETKENAALHNVTLNFSALTTAVNSFSAAASKVAQEIEQTTLSGQFNEELNNRLIQTERKFIGYGVPKRPYYKHVVQAPGLYQGYNPQVFPGVNQAIDAGSITVAQAEIVLTAKAITAAAALLQGSSR